MNEKEIIDKEIEIIYRKCFVFVLDIIQYTDDFIKPKKIAIAEQLLKSASLLGENMNILKNSKANHLNYKLITNVCKYVQKTKYWLYLCKYSQICVKSTTIINNFEELSTLISNLKIKIKNEGKTYYQKK